MLVTLLQWLQDTSLATSIRETRWSMPIFLTFHALGITLLIGTIVIVSLRLLGVVMPNRPLSEIAGQVRRWSIVGLTTMLTSGFLLFIPETIRWYNSRSFWIKMSFLLAATLFHFTVYRRVTTSERSAFVNRLCGAIALVLWYGVALGGRALTFE
jgi:hypothetical protein